MFEQSEGQIVETLLTALGNHLAAQTSVRLEIEVAPDLPLDRAGTKALVLIASEALANSIKHGRSSMILLKLSPESGTRMRIFDDGIGFDVRSVMASRPKGLTAMHDLAAKARGNLGIESSPLQGTKVELHLPPAYGNG